jgi:hypothetical protein
MRFSVGIGIALIFLSLLPNRVHSKDDASTNATSSVITHLVLVNAETGGDVVYLEQDMVVDTDIIGTESLSVRAETIENYTDGGYILWEFAGTRRVETTPPFLLAGKSSIVSSRGDALEIFPSNALRKAGRHSITATPVSTVLLDDAATLASSKEASTYTVTFSIQHGTFEEDSVSEDATAADDDCASQNASTCNSYHRVATDVPGVNADLYGRWNSMYYASSSVMVLAFTGPIAGENGMVDPGTYRAPSTFADYRCDLVVSPIATQNANTNTLVERVVPCFYSGSGNAANTGDTGGLIWQCLVRIDANATPFTWNVSFVQGTNVAATTFASGSRGNPGEFFNGQSGIFSPPTPNILARSLPLDASLFSAGIHAVDFLDYLDFDGVLTTNQTKTYATFVNDTNSTSAMTWGGGRGLEIMGFLARLGANANCSVLSFTALSDHVFPFVDRSDLLAYDISKLAQWEVVLAYAVQMGVSVLLNLQAERIADVDERNVYIREMVARFGPFVAAFVVDSLETAVAVRSLVLSGADVAGQTTAIFWTIDVSSAIVEPVTVSNDAGLNGIILLMSNPTTNFVYNSTISWKTTNPSLLITSIVSLLETGDSSFQSKLLWSNAFAGGSGVLIQYVNEQSDEIVPLFVLTEMMAGVTSVILQSIALQSQLRPNRDILLDNDIETWCLADSMLNFILIYLSEGRNAVELFLDQAVYTVEWIDAASGTVVNDTVAFVSGDDNLLSSPPSNTTDWIARLACTKNCSS